MSAHLDSAFSGSGPGASNMKDLCGQGRALPLRASSSLQHNKWKSIYRRHKGQSNCVEAVPESSRLRRECWPCQVSSELRTGLRTTRWPRVEGSPRPMGSEQIAQTQTSARVCWTRLVLTCLSPGPACRRSGTLSLGPDSDWPAKIRVRAKDTGE